jgi:hypothetical protein
VPAEEVDGDKDAYQESGKRGDDEARDGDRVVGVVE